MDNIEAINTSGTNGNRENVVAIIPAYNEENRVVEVIRVIKNIPVIDRIVVVDDGSSDNTAQVAANTGVEVIRLEQNRGKAAAMDEGVKRTVEPIILFLDADLIFLDEGHIYDLLAPVIEKDADMTMGVFRGGRFRTDIAHRISPGLSGQRAMVRSVWGLLKPTRSMEKVGYGIERELQALAESGKVKLKKVTLNGVSQITKEEKMGPQKGFILRMKMYQDILKAWTLRTFIPQKPD